MTSASTASHWDEAYGHGATTRSWHQVEAGPSLHLLARCSVPATDSVVDVGGGASPFVDALLARGHTDVTVIDISAAGIAAAQRRLGALAAQPEWIVADVLAWRPPRTYDVWHDRALFHFLISDEDRSRYLELLDLATHVGSFAVFATFAVAGPEYCSGLPVTRYSASDLAYVLPGWRLVADEQRDHTTPAGVVQPFTWAAFRRG